MREFSRSDLLYFAIVSIVPAPLACAAGGSYLVDDAAITPNDRCQLETWWRGYRTGAGEAAATPACTWGGVEWSVALSRRGDAGAWSPGAKWASGDPAEDRWTYGVAVGAAHTGGRWTGGTAYLPVSVALDPDHRWTVHANAGVGRVRDGAWSELGGLALDVALDARRHAIVEWHASDGERVAQAGLRWSLAAATDLDIIAGRNDGRVPERWLTVGFNLGF